jgi:hypothetical protein
MQDFQEAGPQPVAAQGKTTGRKRRISQILPQLRQQIPMLFDHGMPAERLAEQFDISKAEILEDMIRDTRGMLSRRGPGSARVMSAGASLQVVAGRRSA